MRQKFTMSDEQFAKIVHASRSVPYMVFGGMAPRSLQENVNEAWRDIGLDLGFDYMTVRPDGPGKRNFTAERLIEESSNG